MKEVVNNPVTVILLSIVTCGIYGLVWVYQVAGAVQAELGEEAPGAGLVIILFFVTCGIYPLIWYYKMGEWLPKIATKYGKSVENEGVLYLVLGLFFVPATWYMIQSKINEIAGE